MLSPHECDRDGRIHLLWTVGPPRCAQGGCIPYHGGLVIDTSRMRKIEVHPEDMIAIVGPGVLKSELNKARTGGPRRIFRPPARHARLPFFMRGHLGSGVWGPGSVSLADSPFPHGLSGPQALEPHGLLFGPDPSSNPSVGGMASTGGSGMTTLKYGTTRENVVSLEVVTPDGWVIRSRQNVRKSATGYELNQASSHAGKHARTRLHTHTTWVSCFLQIHVAQLHTRLRCAPAHSQLYMGSEGTLGVITELVVKLFPAPSLRTGAVVAFPSVRNATAAVVQLLRANTARGRAPWWLRRAV